MECVHSKKVVYKCTICNNFHVGTSEISLEKQVKVEKFYGKPSIPKVVGFVDLSKFPPKKVKIKEITRTDQEIEQVHLQFLIKYNYVMILIKIIKRSINFY